MLCRWPFRHLSIDQNGNFRPCCSWRHEEFMPEYPDVPLVNFDDTSIQDYLQSNFLTTIQNSMKENKFPKGGCSDCQNEMNTSRAPGSLLSYGNEKYKPGDKFELHDVEIKFGNKCNLGCVMCGPSCSSLLEAESDKHYDTIIKSGFEAQKMKPSKNIPWYERDDKIEEIAQFASKAKLIRFTGGEPTVNGYLRKFLSVLKNYNTDIIIKMTTNGFKISQQLLDILPTFKTAWFDFSIDGVGKVNEFVRWPSKWESINENIIRASQLPNSWITVKTTMHAMNVSNVPKICDWAQQNDYIKDWDINIVWEPKHLRPCLVSDEAKQIFVDGIDKHTGADAKCKTVKTGMDVLSTNWSKTEYNMYQSKLHKYLDMLSTIRNLDWKEYVKV